MFQYATCVIHGARHTDCQADNRPRDRDRDSTRNRTQPTSPCSSLLSLSLPRGCCETVWKLDSSGVSLYSVGARIGSVANAWLFGYSSISRRSCAMNSLKRASSAGNAERVQASIQDEAVVWLESIFYLHCCASFLSIPDHQLSSIPRSTDYGVRGEPILCV